MVLSGPSENHETFWKALSLSEHLNFEEPGPVSRWVGVMNFLVTPSSSTWKILLRQRVSRTKMWLEPRPSNLTCSHAIPWWNHFANRRLGDQRAVEQCLARPDLLHSLNELSRQITRWSLNDDRGLCFVFCCLKSAKRYNMRCRLNPDAPWQLRLFTDADHASKVDHG